MAVNGWTLTKEEFPKLFEAIQDGPKYERKLRMELHAANLDEACEYLKAEGKLIYGIPLPNDEKIFLKHWDEFAAAQMMLDSIENDEFGLTYSNCSSILEVLLEIIGTQEEILDFLEGKEE